jgi:hypothetical protein
MHIEQVPVVRHPLLQGIWDLLADEPAGREIVRVPGFRAEVAAGPPFADRQVASTRACAELLDLHGLVQGRYPALNLRGAIYYPPDGGLGWHTNSNHPGWRVYVVRAPGGRSFMRTAASDVLDRDAHANIFRVPGWHCIVAPTERWSIGFVATDVFVEELLSA